MGAFSLAILLRHPATINPFIPGGRGSSCRSNPSPVPKIGSENGNDIFSRSLGVDHFRLTRMLLCIFYLPSYDFLLMICCCWNKTLFSDFIFLISLASASFGFDQNPFKFRYFPRYFWTHQIGKLSRSFLRLISLLFIPLRLSHAKCGMLTAAFYRLQTPVPSCLPVKSCPPRCRTTTYTRYFQFLEA